MFDQVKISSKHRHCNYICLWPDCDMKNWKVESHRVKYALEIDNYGCLLARIVIILFDGNKLTRRLTNIFSYVQAARLRHLRGLFVEKKKMEKKERMNEGTVVRNWGYCRSKWKIIGSSLSFSHLLPVSAMDIGLLLLKEQLHSYY